MEKCNFEGQGSCRICEEKIGWNRYWGCFLYKVPGHVGLYCYKHAKELEDNDKK